MLLTVKPDAIFALHFPEQGVHTDTGQSITAVNNSSFAASPRKHTSGVRLLRYYVLQLPLFILLPPQIERARPLLLFLLCMGCCFFVLFKK